MLSDLLPSLLLAQTLALTAAIAVSPEPGARMDLIAGLALLCCATFLAAALLVETP